MERVLICCSEPDRGRAEWFRKVVCEKAGVDWEQTSVCVLDGGMRGKDASDEAMRGRERLDGEGYVNALLDAAGDAALVLIVVTQHFLKSYGCMVGTGVIWGVNPYVHLMFMEDIQADWIEGTVFSGMQGSWLCDPKFAGNIYQCLKTAQVKMKGAPLPFVLEVKGFAGQVTREEEGKNRVIKPDEDGYYSVWIEAVRKVPVPFRCYKIRGRLELPGIFTEDETHWIFFKGGVYEDLMPGQHVRIRVGKTERRKYQDIGFARNLYPDELYLLNG